MQKEQKFKNAAEEICLMNKVNYLRAADMADEIRGEAKEYVKRLPHIEDRPPLTTDDRMYDWYYVSDPEDLTAVKLALYNPDSAAFDQKIDSYPTWILAATDDDGYGDIQIKSVTELAEMYGSYIGKLVQQMMALTAMPEDA